MTEERHKEIEDQFDAAGLITPKWLRRQHPHLTESNSKGLWAYCKWHDFVNYKIQYRDYIYEEWLLWRKTHSESELINIL